MPLGKEYIIYQPIWREFWKLALKQAILGQTRIRRSGEQIATKAPRHKAKTLVSNHLCVLCGLVANMFCHDVH
jgi:hypothetical protein